MKRFLQRVAFFVGLLVFWHVLASRGIWDESLFPGPIEVGRTIARLVGDGSMLSATSVSLRRVLAGYAISLGLGVPLGIWLARSEGARATVGSLVTGAQALPSICWLPIALLWFGLSDKAILFVVVAGSLVSVTTAVMDGVRNLPPTYVRAARTMGASGLALTTRVILPASLPAVLTGAKLGWAYAWRALMAGELLFVSLGLGSLLMAGRELADMSQVLAVMAAIVTIGLITDAWIFGVLESRVRSRWGLDRS